MASHRQAGGLRRGPSGKRGANGRPSIAGCRDALHLRQPGPGTWPPSSDWLQRQA